MSRKQQHTIIDRQEMLTATLRLGGTPIPLADYATTGLVGVAVAPRGQGKTNAGLVMAEQLSEQGWVSVIVEPEHELEQLYGDAVASPEELRTRLRARKEKVLIVSAASATEFVPYGQVVAEVADRDRKPIFLCIDEGQVFSASRRRGNDIGLATDLVNDFIGRGRKRALDVFITTLRHSATIHGMIFANKNLTLIGCQEDPKVWSTLAPQFRGSGIGFADLHALEPGQFFCFSRRGLEKIRMPMASALQGVARRAAPVRRTLPGNFVQWDRAMREIPTERLAKLNDGVISLLGGVAGLSPQKLTSGLSALQDELASRP